MTKFLEKSFSVGVGSTDYRNGWETIFGRKTKLRSLQKALTEEDPTNDETFKSFLNKSAQLLNVSNKDIAAHFTVSIPTVERWMNGATLPHSKMRPAIFKMFQEMIEKEIKK